MVLGASLGIGLAASGIGLAALLLINLLSSDAWLSMLFLLAYPGVIAARAFHREVAIHWKRLVTVKAR